MGWIHAINRMEIKERASLNKYLHYAYSLDMIRFVTYLYAIGGN